MKKKNEPRVQHLRILLIKPKYKDVTAILKKSGALQSYSIRKQKGFNGTLYVKPQNARDPSWLPFLKPHVEGDIGRLKNRSTAAILLIKVGNDRFALLLGYGRNLLNPESWVHDFGLKVVLNTIDPDSIRSVDCRTFEELTLQTRRQASRVSTFDTFGLNVNQDMLRQVSGNPRDKKFAKGVAGSDGLMIAVPLTFGNLGGKMRELLKAYNGKEYKKRFGFIDDLRRETDPVKLGELDKLLLENLQRGMLDGIHMAPPEPIDWESVEGFTYSSRKTAKVFPPDELSIEDYFNTVDPKDISIDLLKTTHVGVRYGTARESDEKWSVYRCIVAETDHGGRYYVLTCGDWFEIERDFVKRVDKRVRSLASTAILLPDARPTEREDAFNKRVAKNTGFALIDKKCVRIGGSPVEPCDLFSAPGRFIHVKRWSRSATLSHLFSQGTVSADCFMGDQTFRKELRALVSKRNNKLLKLVPLDRPRPEKYQIVFAVIKKQAKGWPTSLPFFSKLNLMNAADHLERLSFKASLTRINVA